MERTKVFEIVSMAVEDLNEELDYPSLAHVTEYTSIYGGEESIDSLSLVQLLVNIEKKIGAESGSPITLADEKAMSWKHSPYRTVGTLVDFIASKVREGNEDTINQETTNHV